MASSPLHVDVCGPFAFQADRMSMCAGFCVLPPGPHPPQRRVTLLLGTLRRGGAFGLGTLSDLQPFPAGPGVSCRVSRRARQSVKIWPRPNESARSSSAICCRTLGRTPLSLQRLVVSGWMSRRRDAEGRLHVRHRVRRPQGAPHPKWIAEPRSLSSAAAARLGGQPNSYYFTLIANSTVSPAAQVRPASSHTIW